MLDVIDVISYGCGVCLLGLAFGVLLVTVVALTLGAGDKPQEGTNNGQRIDDTAETHPIR